MAEGEERGGETEKTLEAEVSPDAGDEASGKKMSEHQAYVKKMLDGCLKHGLTALCKEKPDEPIKWLAHWLLENNPNQPRVCTVIILISGSTTSRLNSYGIACVSHERAPSSLRGTAKVAFDPLTMCWLRADKTPRKSRPRSSPCCTQAQQAFWVHSRRRLRAGP